MNKLKILTLALLPITTIGTTIGITSCSSTTSLEVIKSKYLLQTNIRAALNNYKNINNLSEFMDIIITNEEIAKVSTALIATLTDKNITDLEIISSSSGIYGYKTVTSNFSTPSLGVTQAKVEVFAKWKSDTYKVSYRDSKGALKVTSVYFSSPVIEKKVYECMYQFEGVYDFPLDWAEGQIVWY